MSGRGDGRLIHTSPNPIVTIGLSLYTSSPTLHPSSPTIPSFHVIVSARILTTPHPTLPITLATHLNPLSSLSNRSFTNIHCVSPTSPPSAAAAAAAEEEEEEEEKEAFLSPLQKQSTTFHPQPPQKHIKIYPHSWPHYIWDASDLRASWNFVTIPAQGKGELVIQHELPWEKIRDAHVEKGERYRVSLSDKCLGTRWWGFGSLDEEFKGFRLGTWREDGEDGRGEEREDGSEEEGEDGREEEGESAMGERPEDLALVVEKGDVTFEIG